MLFFKLFVLEKNAVKSLIFYFDLTTIIDQIKAIIYTLSVVLKY